MPETGPAAMKRCDLHLHTRYSAWKHLPVLRARDSYSEPSEVFDRARAAGMDFVAITDHESIEGALRLRDARPETAARLIVGEEIETRFPDTGQWVHVNVFGLDEAEHGTLQRLRPDVRDLVAHLRERRLLYVLNHPFQSFRFQKAPRDYAEEILGLFDHFEVGNSMMPAEHAPACAALLRLAAEAGLSKFGVAGSDAHVPDHVGSSYTAAAGAGPAGWLESVRRGDCRFVTRPMGLPRLLRHVYRAVGGYYAALLTPEGRAGMSAVNYAAAAALLPGAALGVPAALVLLNDLRQRVVTRLARRSLERACIAGVPVAALD